MEKDYKDLVAFWNKSFQISEEDKKQLSNSSFKEDDYKDLAPSSELYEALTLFKNKAKVLDYGAGNGWASIIMAKSGVKKVISVDVAESAKDVTSLYSEAFNVSSKVNAITIDSNWLKEREDEAFDGMFCSNVLDVIPFDMAKEIIKESYRITKKDATVIFSFNYYIDPHKMEERGFKVDGSLIYIDGVLRLNSVSDSDWTCELKKYYQDIELKHFSWPGEKEKTRRLFILKK